MVGFVSRLLLRWVAAGLALCGSVGAADQPPNVLVIVADDLGWGDLGLHGNPVIDTPHLDALAGSGLRLERFHVCPTGAPTMASLLTGRYHYRTGVSGDSRGEGILHAHETTLGRLFGDAGYATGIIGKWLHGSNWPHHPNARGFDFFAGICEEPRHGVSHLQIERNGAPHPTRGLITDALADEAIAFMTIHADAKRPFFCLLPFHAPASPADAPEAAFRKYRDHPLPPGSAAACAMIESIDTNVGRLIGWLESRGLRERTLVWFLSDNGPDLSPGGENHRFNGHLRGAKGSVREGGVRVPSFVSQPGVIPPGSKFRRITAHIDLLPSLAELCGLAPREGVWLDGMSLAPVFTTGEQPDRWPNRLLFTSWTPPRYDVRKASMAVRTDRWIALRDPLWRRGTLSDIHSEWELYDLNADPHEWTDLSDDYPFLLGDMRSDFSRWMDDTTDHGLGPIPTEIGHPEWPTVTFLAREAVIPAEWKTDPLNPTWLTRWTDTAHEARWPVEIVGAGGRYLVEIDLALPATRVPCLMRLSIGESAIEFTLERAHETAESTRLAIGELTLAPGTGDLILKPVRMGEQAIDLRRIRLTKIDP